MERSEMYMIETYKCKELKERLRLISNWNKVKIGQLIYHTDDNNIFNVNKFSEYNKEDNIVWYKNRDGLLYDRSATGWYYYDELIADEVEKHYTPKLYIVSSIKYPEDYWFSVAFDEKQLKECFCKEMKEDLTYEEFQDKYSYEELKTVDNFDIVLK